MPEPAPAVRPTVSLLVGLWHGDRHSFGYQSPALALEVARLKEPGSELLLLREFYPVRNNAIPDEQQMPHACDLSEIPLQAKVIIEKAWRLYCYERLETGHWEDKAA